MGQRVSLPTCHRRTGDASSCAKRDLARGIQSPIHVWQLFGFPLVFLMGAVLGYVVWWKRDVRISISLHVFNNVLTSLMLLTGALAV